MPRNQKPQEHPAAIKAPPFAEAPRPVAAPQDKGRALSDCTDAEIIADYVRHGLGSAFDRKTYQRTYMRDYMRKRRMTA